MIDEYFRFSSWRHCPEKKIPMIPENKEMGNKLSESIVYELV